MTKAKLQKILAIDFDGVIHDKDHPVPGRRMGAPVEGAHDAIWYLRALEYKIVVFTVWGGSDQGQKTIREWMDYYDIPFDEITNVKPNAEAYIDDRGIHFDNWEAILKIYEDKAERGEV